MLGISTLANILAVLCAAAVLFSSPQHGVHASLTDVSFEGPIGNYVFLDKRVCSDGRAYVAITNDNAFDLTITVSDPNLGQTYAGNVTIGQGLTVLPWQIGDVTYTGDTPLQIEASGETGVFTDTVVLVVMDNVVMAPVQDNQEKDVPIPINVELVTIYDTEFSLEIIDNVTGLQLHSEDVTVTDPGIKVANMTYTPTQSGRQEIRLTATTINGVSQINQIFDVATMIPDATLEFDSTLARPLESFYPTDEVNLALTATMTVTTYPRGDCIIEYGDGTDPDTLTDVSLAPDAEDHMLEIAHNFTALGEYNVSVSCSNQINSISAELTLFIVNPIVDCSAGLVDLVVPLNKDTGLAEAAVILDHAYLTTDYDPITIELNFALQGVSNYVTTMKQPVDVIKQNYSVKAEYTVTVTFSAFGEEGVITLNLRVGIIDVFIENKPAYVRKDIQQTLKAVRYTDTSSQETATLTVGGASATIVFGPGYSEEMALYTYTTTGLQIVTLSMVYMGIEELAEYSVTVFEGCISTQDLFQAEYRDPANPILVLISAVPSISGRAIRTDKCKDNEHFIFNWRLYRNTGLAPVYTWVPIPLEQPESISLTMSKYALEEGLYQVVLDLNVTENAEEFVSDKTHVQARLPSIVARVSASVAGSSFSDDHFTGAGSLQQVVIGRDVELDVTSSYDPAEAEINLSSVGPSTLAYTWNCYSLGVAPELVALYTAISSDDTSYRDLPACTGVGMPPAEGTITVPTAGLGVGELLLFEVMVNANVGSRQDEAIIVLEMVNGDRPGLALVCIWNCEAKLLPTERSVFGVEIDCPSCSNQDLYLAEYTWTLSKYSPDTNLNEEIAHASWDSRITSEPTAKTFDAEGDWWEEETSYSLHVEVRIPNRLAVEASINLFPDVPPYNGTCDVEPSSGRAADTLFRFSSLDWQDEYDRLSKGDALDAEPFLLYRVKQLPAGIETPVLFEGGETISPGLVLGACPMCDVELRVVDPYGMVSTCSVSVEVAEYADPELAVGNETFAMEILDDLAIKFNDSLATNDPIKVAQGAATYATILSSLDILIEPEPETVQVTPEMFSTSGSEDGKLPPEFDSSTLDDPMETLLKERAAQYVDEIALAVGDKKGRGELTTPEDVELFANAMTASTASTKLMKGSTLEVASETAAELGETVADLIARKKQKTIGSVERALSGIAGTINNVVKSTAIDVKGLDPDVTQLGPDRDQLTGQEQEYFAKILADRRKYKVQSVIDKAPNIVTNLRRAWDMAFNVSAKLQNARGRYRINNREFRTVSQRTTRAEILAVARGETNDTALDDLLGFSVDDVLVEDEYAPLVIQVVSTENVFIHGEHSKFITSSVVLGSVADESGIKQTMTTGRVEHDTGVNCTVLESELTTIYPTFIDGDAAELFYHSFDYPDANARVCIQIRGTDPDLYYRLYVKIGSAPTDLNYDLRMTINQADMNECSEICLAEDKLSTSGTGYLGLRPLEVESPSGSRRKRDTSGVVDPLLAPYLFGVTAVACYSWEDTQVDWVASMCTMSRVGDQVKCECSSTNEVISAASFNVAPNMISFSSVFSQFDFGSQAAVLGTLTAIYFLFALLGIWANYKDRSSIKSWGVFPLEDNYASDDYYYLITVHTGLRRAAGTKSKVGFCIRGSLQETGVRVLSDGVREGFPTGSVQHLVMAVPRFLGGLETLRIWHDNSGHGDNAHWYLDRVDVTDLQTGHAYHFMCEEWLTPEDSLDRLIQSSNAKDLETLKSAFYANTKHKATEEHLWLSVFIRPDRSRFSRLERVGCCLTFLMLAMITSAMFYQGADDVDRKQPSAGLEIGPVKFSPQQIYYSIVAAVISSIPMMAIIYLFRKARTYAEPGRYWCCGGSGGGGSARKARLSDSTQGLHDGESGGEATSNDGTSSEVWTDWVEELKEFGIGTEDGDEKKLESRSVKSANVDKSTIQMDEKTKEDKSKHSSSCCCCRLPWMEKLESQLEELEKILLIKQDADVPNDTWPRVWRHVAWILAGVAIAASSFFIVLYSMQWGKDVSEEWLSACFLAFLQSLCLVDPFKVLAFSFLISLCIRKNKLTSVDQLNLKVISDVNKEYGIKNKPNPPRKTVSYTSTVSDEELQYLTLRRRIQVMMRSTLRELAVHALFLLLVCSICYGNRSSLDFRLFDVLNTGLVKGTSGKCVNDDGSDCRFFSKVTNTKEYFEFVHQVLSPWLFPETDWQGNSLVGADRQFTQEPNLYRLGAPRLRQMRMPKDDCPSDKVDSLDCILQYDMYKEQTEEFCVGWGRMPCPQIDQLRVTAGAWYFRHAVDIWGIPMAGDYDMYSGGGYIANLDINLMVAKATLAELEDLFWIDRHTRAVFLEFTVYCANTNRFAYIVLLAEVLDTGGVVPYVTIYPFTAYHPSGALGTYLTLCKVLGMIFTVFGVLYIIFVFNAEGVKAAVKDLWFVLDILAVVFALAATAMDIARLSYAKDAIDKMNADPTKFVNFQHVVVWDTAFIVCLAFLVSIGSLRLLKLAGYSKKTMRVYRVLKLATGSLPGFFAYIFLTLTAFSFLGILWFGRTGYNFRSWIDCMQNLFTGVLGKTGFKDTGLPETQKHLTMTYFILFGVIVVQLLANYFIAILTELLTVNEQRDCEEVHGDTAKIFAIMWDSFMRALGRKRDPLERLRKKKNDSAQEDDTAKSDNLLDARTFSRLDKALTKWLENHEDGLTSIIKGCGKQTTTSADLNLSTKDEVADETGAAKKSRKQKRKRSGRLSLDMTLKELRDEHLRKERSANGVGETQGESLVPVTPRSAWKKATDDVTQLRLSEGGNNSSLSSATARAVVLEEVINGEVDK